MNPNGVWDCTWRTGVVNSYVFDFLIRNRLGGQSLIWAVLEETPISSDLITNQILIGRPCASLALPNLLFSPRWLQLTIECDFNWRDLSWKRLWAITPHERLRLRCLLDAVVAELYGLDRDDLAWILRDCDHPIEQMRDNSFTRILDPKGFWRVDKDKDPELRHTVLTLAAFRDLKATITDHGSDRDKGIEAFCTQSDGDGWMLPETLCLTDLGLGHDGRAKEPQPVRSRLGERFLPWQLEQSVEDSWAECERHARNILGEEGFARLQAELRGESTQATHPPSDSSDEHSEKTPTLFGNAGTTQGKKKTRGRKR